MNHDTPYPDAFIRGILNTVRTIAMVGVSPKENRPSYSAFKYLLERGYRMIPVNPGHAGKELLGQRVYAALSDIPEPVDMVDIFRASRYALPIVKEMIQYGVSPRSYHHLLAMSRATAFFRGRNYVSPSDVKYIATDVMHHRLVRTIRAEVEGVATDAVVAEVLRRTTIP